MGRDKIAAIDATLNQEHILQFFQYGHLPEPLRAISRHFAEIAHGVIMPLPRSPERTVALRKLLESKDAAVRAAIAQ
jgi:hypothetical protein